MLPNVPRLFVHPHVQLSAAVPLVCHIMGMAYTIPIHSVTPHFIERLHFS